jgi:hypothetical protein
MQFSVPSRETFFLSGRVGPVGRIDVGAQENTWVVNTRWSVDGVLVADTSGLPWSYPPRGEPYLVRVELMDSAGNWGERTFPLTVDADGPSVTAMTPSDGARVRGSQVVSSVQAGDASGVFMAQLDGAPALIEAPYTASVPAGADGPRTLTWRVQDTVGNTTFVHRSVIVDNTGPVVISASPANGALVRGAWINSNVVAVDTSGVTRAQLAGASADFSAPYSSRIAAGRDGKHTLTWTVQDQLGNTTVARRTVTVDNTKPRFTSVKAPKDKARVTTTVTVTASASDSNGVARVQLLVNGKVVATDITAAYKFKVNTKKYGKKLKIQLRAYDKAGNVTTTPTRTWTRR